MKASESFVNRRKALMLKLPDDAVAIIPSATHRVRSNDVDYPFRQNSDFLYLKGFNESDAVLVLTGGASGQSILFCQPSSVQTEIWIGPLMGPEQAKLILSMDVCFPFNEFNPRLVEILAGKTAIYYPFLQTGQWEKPLFNAWRTSRGQRREDKGLESAFIDLSPILAEMRLFK